MAPSDGWIVIIEFIIGVIMTQLLLIVLFAVIGGFDAVTSGIEGQWKENYEGIKSSVLLLFILLDIVGGVGFVVTVQGLFNRGS
jgi:hypothetical protein